MRGSPLTLLYLYNSLSNDNDVFLSWFSCCYLNPHSEQVFCIKDISGNGKLHREVGDRTLEEGGSGRQSTNDQDMWIKTFSTVFTKIAPGVENRYTE